MYTGGIDNSLQISYLYGPLAYSVLPPGEWICNNAVSLFFDVVARGVVRYTDLRCLMPNFETENFRRKPYKITCNTVYLYINFNIQCLRTNCALSVSISVCCPQRLTYHDCLFSHYYVLAHNFVTSVHGKIV